MSAAREPRRFALEVRFDRMCSSAETIAARLIEHPAVGPVRYPGLPDDPAHNLARMQMDRFGFLRHALGFLVVALCQFVVALRQQLRVDGDEGRGECALAENVLKEVGDAERRLEGIQPATSFGGVHTAAERRARWGDAVAPGYVRLSVGCEPVEELWKAIDEALPARF